MYLSIKTIHVLMAIVSVGSMMALPVLTYTRPKSRPRPLRRAARAGVWRSRRCREVDPAHAGGVHGGGSGIQEGRGDPKRAIEADMMASHANVIYRTRSLGLRVLHSGCRQVIGAMMVRQARRSSAIPHASARSGFLSRRSYVAPSPRGRTSAKRPKNELTYCPIYGFKPCVICTKDLTPALFYPHVPLSERAHNRVEQPLPWFAPPVRTVALTVR